MYNIEINRPYNYPYASLELKDIETFLIKVKNSLKCNSTFSNLQKEERIKLVSSIIKEWLNNIKSYTNIEYKLIENNWDLSVEIYIMPNGRFVLDNEHTINLEPTFDEILDREFYIASLNISKFINKMVEEKLMK